MLKTLAPLVLAACALDAPVDALEIDTVDPTVRPADATQASCAAGGDALATRVSIDSGLEAVAAVAWLGTTGVVLSDWEGRVVIVDLAGGARWLVEDGSEDWADAQRVLAASDRTVLGIDGHGEATTWDTATGGVGTAFQIGWVQSAALSGEVLAGVSSVPFVVDIGSGHRTDLATELDETSHVAWLPDALVVAGSVGDSWEEGEPGLELRDRANPQLILDHYPQRDERCGSYTNISRVVDVAFDLRSRRLLSVSSGDYTVLTVHDRDDLRHPISRVRLDDHWPMVGELLFGGDTFVTVGWDGARFWDADTGEELTRLDVEGLISLQMDRFTGDVLTASYDGVVEIRGCD